MLMDHPRGPKRRHASQLTLSTLVASLSNGWGDAARWSPDHRSPPTVVFGLPNPTGGAVIALASGWPSSSAATVLQSADFRSLGP
jgi:hypothetical protein